MIPDVRREASKFSGAVGVDSDDLFQEGMIGSCLPRVPIKLIVARHSELMPRFAYVTESFRL